VSQHIIEQAEKLSLSDMFEEVLVPSEEVVEIRKGNKKSKCGKEFFSRLCFGKNGAK